MSDLPVLQCGSCVLCCQRQDITLDKAAGDRASDYDCVRKEGRWVLRKQANGDCVYLRRNQGCTIYRRRPALCRQFDCRVVTLGRPDIVARGEELRGEAQ